MIKYISYLDLTPSRAVTRRMDKTIALAGLSSMSQKHGAILYSGGRLISLGVNVSRNVPSVHMPYAAISRHAEINALRYGYLNQFSPEVTGTLYVARISKGGNVSHSKPCGACREYLERFTSISKVIHT